MSIVWEHLSEFEQFSLLIHGFKGEHRFMGIMNVAYCDESEDKKRDPRKVYTVSGYLSKSLDWFELGRRWDSALKEQGLTTTGFHMSKCESGSEDPYRLPRDGLDSLQRCFIDIVNDTPLWGYACAIVKHYKPYYLAFQQVIEEMCTFLDNLALPRNERIAFVFDQQQEFQGNAKDLYDSVKRSKRLTYLHRLGSLTFDSRLSQPQLQAADIWAYESMRHIRDVRIKGEQPRWQYERLHGGRACHIIKVLDREPERLPS